MLISMGNFGKQLYIIRKQKNLTLRELEKLSGVKFVRIGRFENNMEKPSLETIKKLEKALNVNFEEIEGITQEIKDLYKNFVDSLLYDTINFENIISNINENKEKYLASSYYSVIMLIVYIINILKNDFINIDNAEKELERLLEPKSDYLQLYYEYKGMRKYLEEKKDEAVNILESALTIANNKKQNTMIYYHLSMVNISRNKYIEALKYADLAKRGFVEFASFKRILYTDGQIGSIYSQMQRFDLAIEKYKMCLISCKTLSLSPNIKALFIRNLSWIYIKNKDYITPLAYLQEAEELDPKSIQLKMYKIWCNYKLEKYNAVRSLIYEYRELKKVKSHKQQFKLFSELIYNAGSKPTLALIDLAIATYNEFATKRDYELMNFYIDIVIDLLKQRDDDKMLIQYLETKIRINDEINKN